METCWNHYVGSAVDRTMSDFAINPPVHLREQPEHPIRSLEEAAAVVRRFARDHFDAEAESVLHRIGRAVDFERARQAELAFRAWAGSVGLLLVPPEDRQAGRGPGHRRFKITR
jgi:hypothetical protein